MTLLPAALSHPALAGACGRVLYYPADKEPYCRGLLFRGDECCAVKLDLWYGAFSAWLSCMFANAVQAYDLMF